MAPLPTNLRRDLERAIVEARKAAERGARAALGSLTVGDAKVGPHLDAAGRNLRNRLRAHARQLGDTRSGRGEQAIERLVRECAYEHWHRMLFARFLAENDLLIEPQSGVSVSLDDVQELAREQGVKPWPLAASFAQRMLPQIFRTDDPVLAIDLPTETVLRLESLLEGLPADVFTADDSLGWTYQFWQSAEKDAVNDRVKSGEKITGETLPAVTQLFTEHYMVLFLLHNTIGAWHAGKTLTSCDREGAESEQRLRDAVRLAPAGGISGYDFEYLRFVRDPKEGEDLNAGTGPWRPAAGTYDGWPKTAAELRVLDPCCGSGHFLVAAFDLLVRLRIAEEGLDTEAAIRAVLADNLFGLELDARCTQIAAFNLAFAAWRMTGRPIDLPPLHIACSGLGPNCSEEEWIRIAESRINPDRRGAMPTAPLLPPLGRGPVRDGLRHLHALFSQAPELGSLIDPTELLGDLITADYETLLPFLSAILAEEGGTGGDEDTLERAVFAEGMAKAAEILAGDFTLVITNVPYLGRGSQSDTLKVFAETNYKEAKADLATIFVARMLRWVGDGRNGTPAGAIAAVTPQNWLFLTSYKKLRERLLKERSWDVVVRMGEHAFESSAAAGAFAAMLTISGVKAGKDHIMAGVDVSNHRGQPPIYATAKAALLRGEAAADAPPVATPAAPSPATPVAAEDNEPDTPPDVAGPADGSVRLVPQVEQVKNPDSVVLTERLSRGAMLHEVASVWEGLSTGDSDRFVRSFWELDAILEPWVAFQGPPPRTMRFGGRDSILFWEQGGGELSRSDGARVQGQPAWGKTGIIIGQMSELKCGIYAGDIHDKITGAIVPHRESHLPAVWAFCEDASYSAAIRKINTKLNVATATLVKVPFDLDHWQKVAAEKYPNGLPEPQSDDPTQWLFHGRPERAGAHAALQVGVARLVGYRWPAELDEDMRLAPEARALVERCAELAEFADEDGIVCLSPLRGEASAADRLRRLLAAAFGSDWSNAKERELLTAAAMFHKESTPASNLDAWLRESFFEQHCKLFHHRPFVWHIWDGRKDGFNALVSYHQLAGPDGAGRRTLEALTYSYLGDWIQRQQDGVKSDEPGAEARLAAAMELKDQLEKILAGEPPYDIFVRWKSVHEQPIGWEPDINDGVRLNVRPFMNATLSKGKKGAGVLRWKPNIKWEKDRGKEPEKLRPREMFPWFWGWDEKKAEHAIDFGSGLKDTAPAGREFDGNRWNDLHYTNAAKQAARERESEEVS